MTLGERLKQLRTNSDKTAEEAAKLLNINRSTLSNYENDVRKPDYDTLLKLADFYNVKIDYLLGQTDKKKIYTAKELMTILDEGLIKDFEKEKIKKIKFVADTALDDISLDELRMAVYAIRQAKSHKD